MFKFLIFVCFLAFAAAKPGALYADPVVSTYSAGSPFAYSAPLAYSAYSSPVAYTSAYSNGLVRSLPYGYPSSYVY